MTSRSVEEINSAALESALDSVNSSLRRGEPWEQQVYIRAENERNVYISKHQLLAQAGADGREIATVEAHFRRGQQDALQQLLLGEVQANRRVLIGGEDSSLGDLASLASYHLARTGRQQLAASVGPRAAQVYLAIVPGAPPQQLPGELLQWLNDLAAPRILREISSRRGLRVLVMVGIVDALGRPIGHVTIVVMNGVALDGVWNMILAQLSPTENSDGSLAFENWSARFKLSADGERILNTERGFMGAFSDPVQRTVTEGVPPQYAELSSEPAVSEFFEHRLLEQWKRNKYVREPHVSLGWAATERLTNIERSVPQLPNEVNTTVEFRARWIGISARVGAIRDRIYGNPEGIDQSAQLLLLANWNEPIRRDAELW